MQEARPRRVHSIESQLRRSVLVPIAAVAAVWLAVSGYLAYGASMQHAAIEDSEGILGPTAITLITAMDERSATAAYLERPEESRAAMEDARAEFDAHMVDFVDRLENGMPSTSHAVHDRLRTLERSFDAIHEVRYAVDQENASRSEVLDHYNELTAVGADLFEEQARATPSQEAVGAGMSAVTTFRAIDELSRADTQLIRSFATGELGAADQAEFTRLAGSYHARIDALNGFVGSKPQDTLNELQGSADWGALADLETTITERTVSTSTDPDTGEREEDRETPVSENEWRAAYAPVKEALGELGDEQAEWYAQMQKERANWAIALAVGGSAGIAMLGAGALTFTTRSARATVARLLRLRDETRDLANLGLPKVLGNVRENRGEPICTEALRVSGEDEDDEIGEVARSFNTAHRTAVHAAIEQTEMRQGVNRVFLNIAHRSQTLVHRQLKLLDKMERDQEDPSQLTDLFKLDHLATRSRRNAENLLILGGETPGRTWHRPMPLIDVLRGAISESGDYTRVHREHVAQMSLASPAVADVIHLVAELVDNATTFSPPHTRVTLNSVQVANGVTVEIEDRGLGMQAHEFEAANAMLANPPEFDVMRLNEQTRLGLFVVSRLAHRHNITVRLRGSPYGGTQAIVLLPPAIVVADPPQLPRSIGPDNASLMSKEPEDGDSMERTDDTTVTPDSRGRVSGHTPLKPNGSATSGTYTAAGLPKRGRNSAESANEAATTPAPETPSQTEDVRPRLPKRTPQAHLAPQLYDAPGTPRTPTEASTDVTEQERSDQLRRTMTAFQHGTQRGRLNGHPPPTDTEKDS